MSSRHCPLCDTTKIIAIGAVAYSDGMAIEHQCTHCGHTFYLEDRRKHTHGKNESPANTVWRQARIRKSARSGS